jgi:hypothetical protein
MTRPATAWPEDALLGRSRQAAVLAGVVAVTAVVFALAADHGTLASIRQSARPCRSLPELDNLHPIGGRADPASCRK